MPCRKIKLGERKRGRLGRRFASLCGMVRDICDKVRSKQKLQVQVISEKNIPGRTASTTLMGKLLTTCEVCQYS